MSTISPSNTTVVTGQNNPANPNSGLNPPTNSNLSSTSNSSGTPEQTAQACTEGSKALVSAYTTCISIFPTSAMSTVEADNGGRNFVQCICSSEWQAGSISQIASSIPICPSIPGITKGGQAAVSSDCASGQPLAQKGRIILNFGLQSKVQGKVYIPLAGLPPGVTSTSTSISPLIMGILIYALL